MGRIEYVRVTGWAIMVLLLLASIVIGYINHLEAIRHQEKVLKAVRQTSKELNKIENRYEKDSTSRRGIDNGNNVVPEWAQ